MFSVTYTYMFIGVCFLSTVCSRSVNTGNVTDSVCHLTSDCTFSECCTEIPFLQRSFRTYLNIDPCNFVMVVGIETYSRNISLSGYPWGGLNCFTFYDSPFVLKSSGKPICYFIFRNTRAFLACRNYKNRVSEDL